MDRKRCQKRRLGVKTLAVFILVISLESFTTSSVFNKNFDSMNSIVSAALDELYFRADPEAKKKIERLITETSQENNLDPLVVTCVINVESSFRLRAVSKKGAVGLMQIMPSVGNSLAEKIIGGVEVDLVDPAHNIRLGTYYLSELINRFEDINTALLAYNFGPTRVLRALNSGEKLPEGYLKRVKSCYNRFLSRSSGNSVASVAY